MSDEVVQNDVDSPDAFYDTGCFVCISAAPGGDGPPDTTLPPDDPLIVTPVCTTETNPDVSEFSICNFVGILDYGPTVVDEPTETFGPGFRRTMSGKELWQEFRVRCKQQ